MPLLRRSQIAISNDVAAFSDAPPSPYFRGALAVLGVLCFFASASSLMKVRPLRDFTGVLLGTSAGACQPSYAPFAPFDSDVLLAAAEECWATAKPGTRPLLASAAMTLARRSAELSPHSSRAWLLVGRIASDQGRPLEASEALKMSFYTGPGDLKLLPRRLALAASLYQKDEAGLAPLLEADARSVSLIRSAFRGIAVKQALEAASQDGKLRLLRVFQEQDPTLTEGIGR